MEKFLFHNALRYRLARHLLFFAIMVLIFAVLLFLHDSQPGFTVILRITFINALFFFCYAYVTIFLLVPVFLLTRKPVWFVLLFLLTGIALSAIKLLVSDQIFYAALSPENIQSHGMFNFRFIVVNTKDMTFIVAIFCIGKFVKDFIYTERVRTRLETETQEARRRLYQVQFDPHFLFNTINNLYAISLINPEKAINIIGRIKVVLQFIINDIQNEFTALENEITFVKNYIQLEKLRYGNRLKIDFIIDGHIENVKIPPMILFFLVENSFRHGSSPDNGSPWIHIRVKTGSGKLSVQVENSKPAGHEKQKQLSQPLANLRKRLGMIYRPDGFKLDVGETENSFNVNLEIS
jgi:two-component system, LytTR family, sensor kinase